jgi:two-component sensor histidine kinase
MVENNNFIDVREYCLLIFPIIIIFLLTGVGLLIHRNKKNLKKNRILDSLNFELQNSIQNKDLQLREIHHRIKNNLQLIVSLLNIEANCKSLISIDDFLLKGQTRIHSIAAVHQNLYETEFTNAVNLQNYIESIAQNLSHIYNNDVKIEINANNIVLDIETAIPIGLIITELICNAFKHAFIETNQGKIKIEVLKKNNKYELNLEDNGVGFPESNELKIASGIKLVSMMVMQINGSLNKKNKKGAVYNISF